VDEVFRPQLKMPLVLKRTVSAEAWTTRNKHARITPARTRNRKGFVWETFTLF